MISGLHMVMIAAAQAADVPHRPAQPPAQACSPDAPPAEGDEIVICVEKPEGFRIDPAIMEAQRQAKRKKLKPPERLADTSCQSVGIMGCRGGAGVNVLAAALTAVEMAKRAAKGENVGEMFVTDPQPDEYQLYLEARRKRDEAKPVPAVPVDPAVVKANQAEAEAAPER